MYSPWTILIVLAVVLLIVWLVMRSRRQENYTPSIYDKVHSLKETYQTFRKSYPE